MLSTEPEFIYCDYTNPFHKKELVRLLNHYMDDPMGDSPRLTPEQEKLLVEGLSANTNSFVLFAKIGNQMAGFITCFINFSTFKTRPYLNVHDVVVHKDFRGQGIGKKLMQKCIAIARERGYCKLTLEVRDDNHAAKALYKSLGFRDCEPLMHFWTKTL